MGMSVPNDDLIITKTVTSIIILNKIVYFIVNFKGISLIWV